MDNKYALRLFTAAELVLNRPFKTKFMLFERFRIGQVGSKMERERQIKPHLLLSPVITEYIVNTYPK